MHGGYTVQIITVFFFCRRGSVSSSPAEDIQKIDPQVEIKDRQSERERKSLLACLFKLSGNYLVMSAFFEILYTVLYFLPVYILRYENLENIVLILLK